MERINRRTLSVCSCAALACALIVTSTGRAFNQEQRFPQLTLDHLTEAQRPVAQEILKVSSSGLGGPYNAMLRSPLMAERMLGMLDYVRFRTTMPHRLNEFAILIQARLWKSQVVWVAHYPLAIKAGLSESVADDLKVNKRPKSMKPDEAVVYDFCMEVSTKHQVSDATWKRARAIFSEQQIVDLIAANGVYVTTAMFLSVSQQSVPPGNTPPLR
jgi:4-carboxymuconolactone decarboxylase